MLKNDNKGILIAIDGVDSSGKETQSKLLYKRLKEEGYPVMRVSFPDYESPSSGLVKMYLAGEFGEDPNTITPYVASTFYAADRFASYTTKWKAFYLEGGIIIADRYTTANMVHQAAKIQDQEEKNLFLDWLWHLEFEVYKIPVPDRVFFLDMPPEKAIALMANRANKFTGDTHKDIHEKDASHLTMAYNNALSISDKYGWECIACVREDKVLSFDEIHEGIYQKAIELIHEKHG